MKMTFYPVMAAVISLVAASCSVQEFEERENKGSEERIFTISASLAESVQTRTSMSANEGAQSYSVLWSATDAICLNGEVSESIAIDESDASLADFTFLQGVTAPMMAVYPASAASDYSADGPVMQISLPLVQTYTDSEQFDPAVAVMTAYSADGTSLGFSHAMAYLRIRLTAGTGTSNIGSVIISANGNEALSGTMTASYATGELEMSATSSSSTVTLDCGTEGAPLGSIMVVAIPAGTYDSGLTVLLKDVGGQYQVKKAVNSFTAQAGSVYPMEFTYEPDGTWTENDIFSVADWEAFAKRVTDGETFEGKTVRLLTDLTVPTYFAYAQGAFAGTFEGNGKSMTANANMWPLFTTIASTGTVQNLVIKGKFTHLANPAMVGNATICRTNSGRIYNVVNYSDTDVTFESGLIFGTIAAQNGGVIEKCINYGNINVTLAAPSGSKLAFYGGGISAIGHTVLTSASTTALNVDATCTPGSFIDCENHGNITATVTTGGISIKSSYGGICGMVYMNGVKFSGCKNTGAVSRISAGEGTGQGAATVGGILGRSAGWFVSGTGDTTALDNGGSNGFDTVYENCTNEGTVHSQCRHSAGIQAGASGARIDAAGGIVGAAIGKGENVQKITGCTNTGTITGGWNRDVNTTSLGGLVGLATITQITGSTSTGTITSLSADAPVGAAAGAVGFARESVTVSGNCIISPKIILHQENSSKSLFYGLVIGNTVTSASISDSSVSGSISLNGAAIEVTSENFTSHLFSASTNAQPATSNLTWYVK